MQVKKFEAKTIKEALQLVKTNLGPEAIILSARDNQKTFGLNGQAGVEVTAAVTDTTLYKKKLAESKIREQDLPKYTASSARAQKQFIDRVMTKYSNPEDKRNRDITRTPYIEIIDDDDNEPSPSERLSDVAEKRIRLATQRALSAFNVANDEPIMTSAKPQITQYHPQPQLQTQIQSQSQFQIQSEPHSQFYRQSQNQNQSQNQTQYQTQKPSQPQSQYQPHTQSQSVTQYQSQSQASTKYQTQSQAQINSANIDGSEIFRLRNEVLQLKNAIEQFKEIPQSFINPHPGIEYGLPYELSGLFQKLCNSGINREIVAEILIQATKTLDTFQIKKIPVVEAWVAHHILNTVTITEPTFNPKIHVFIGANGQGKTLSLIKIASRAVIYEKKRIAILMSEHSKVGAIDQMKIYAQILNVPFGLIKPNSDWPKILKQLEHLDHIYVDTPGFSLRDNNSMETVKALIPWHEPGRALHYVQSVSMKDDDAFMLIEPLKTFGITDVIFTFLDEASKHGLIYNLQRKFAIPLAYFSVGAKVPEDIEVATPERVLDLIFKLTKTV